MPQIPVEIRPALDPAGRPGVLLQLPDGYVVMQPEDAYALATRLRSCAAEVLMERKVDEALEQGARDADRL